MRHSVIERTLNFDPDVLRLSGDAYLEGYWASEKYFKDVEPLLRRELVVKTPPSEANVAMAERIGQVTAVSVHVRRGTRSLTRAFAGTSLRCRWSTIWQPWTRSPG